MGKRKPWDTNLCGYKNNTAFMMYYSYLQICYCLGMNGKIYPNQ